MTSVSEEIQLGARAYSQVKNDPKLRQSQDPREIEPVKRVAARAYRAQGRGGRGVRGHTMREEDEVAMLFQARSLDTILFFSDKGKVYSEKAYQIPDSDRMARGIPMANILSVESGEAITAAVAAPDFEAASYCTMVTRGGRIKNRSQRRIVAVPGSSLNVLRLAEPAGRCGQAPLHVLWERCGIW